MSNLDLVNKKIFTVVCCYSCIPLCFCVVVYTCMWRKRERERERKRERKKEHMCVYVCVCACVCVCEGNILQVLTRHGLTVYDISVLRQGGRSSNRHST